MDDIERAYTQHFTDVYRYVYSLCRDETTAEDVTSETFLKAIKAIGKFRGECSLRVWLCQIAKNTYFSYLKKAKGEFLGLEAETQTSTVEEHLVNKEAAMEIHRQLRALEEPYKEVFHLRTFGELSFAEIAELFAKTENWARVTYHRAKLKLKEALSWNAE